VGPPPSGATRWFGVNGILLSEVDIYASQQPLSTPMFEGLLTHVRGRLILRRWTSLYGVLRSHLLGKMFIARSYLGTF